MQKTPVSAVLALFAFGAQAQMLKAAQVPAAVKATEAAPIVSAVGVTTYKAQLTKAGK